MLNLLNFIRSPSRSNMFNKYYTITPNASIQLYYDNNILTRGRIVLQRVVGSGHRSLYDYEYCTRFKESQKNLGVLGTGVHVELVVR